MTEDLIMLLVNDFYHDYQTLIRQIRFYQSQLHAELKDILTEERLSSFLAVTLRENLFFPMKLYAHDRIKDKELLNNVIRAYQDFAKNKTA